MNFRTTVVFSYLIVCAIVAFPSKAIAEPYLFEMLTKPIYYKSWNSLFVGEKNIDTWLTRYAKTKNGPATPGKAIQLGKTRYQINMICQRHACGDNQFFVLFDQDGTKAWGLLLKDGKMERFFGNPDDEKKKALLAAAYE